MKERLPALEATTCTLLRKDIESDKPTSAVIKLEGNIYCILNGRAPSIEQSVNAVNDAISIVQDSWSEGDRTSFGERASGIFQKIHNSIVSKARVPLQEVSAMIIAFGKLKNEPAMIVFQQGDVFVLGAREREGIVYIPKENFQKTPLGSIGTDVGRFKVQKVDLQPGDVIMSVSREIDRKRSREVLEEIDNSEIDLSVFLAEIINEESKKHRDHGSSSASSLVYTVPDVSDLDDLTELDPEFAKYR